MRRSLRRKASIRLPVSSTGRKLVKDDGKLAAGVGMGDCRRRDEKALQKEHERQNGGKAPRQFRRQPPPIRQRYSVPAHHPSHALHIAVTADRSDPQIANRRLRPPALEASIDLSFSVLRRPHRADDFAIRADCCTSATALQNADKFSIMSSATP
jgi:hypothetical protein